MTLVLGLLFVVSSVTAAYALAAVWSLRDIEATWLAAMAVDRARAEADAEIATTFRNLDSRDDPAATAATTDIGGEAAGILSRFEDELRARRIIDSRVSAVRNAMADALQFRRRQMTPTRRTLGDTPLQDADAALAAALRRWRLSPKPPVPTASLASVESARVNLRHMVDSKTGTILLATDSLKLYVIDIDRDTTKEIEIGLPHGYAVRIVVGQSPNAVVVVQAGLEVKAYDLTSGEQVWELPGYTIAKAPSPALAWVADGYSVVPVGADGRPTGPSVTLPRGLKLLGSAGDRLVLTDIGFDVNDTEVWDPRIPNVAPTLLGHGSLVAASAEQIAFQPQGTTSVRLVRLPGLAERTIELPPTGAGPGAFSSDDVDLAFPAGPPAGRVASILQYHSVTSRLTGVGGPSALISGGVVWSASGRDLFWLTAEGRIAVRTAGNEPRIVRTPYEKLTQLAGVDVSDR